MSRYNKRLVALFEAFAKEAGPGPVDANDVWEWAEKNGYWKPEPGLARKRFVQLLGRALRGDTILDDQGRRVRAKHSAVVKRGDVSLHLWDDIRRADHEHMARSFTQRRNMVVDDCAALKADVDYYNNLRPERPAIQLDLDFTPDVAEREALERIRKEQAISSSSAPEPPAAQSPRVVPASASQPSPSLLSSRRVGRARRRQDSSPR